MATDDGEPFRYGKPDRDGIEVDIDTGDVQIVAVYADDVLAGIIRDLTGRIQRRLEDGDGNALPTTVYVKVGFRLYRTTFKCRTDDKYVVVYVMSPPQTPEMPPVSARFPHMQDSNAAVR